MHERRRALLVAYGTACLSTGLSLLLRWPLWPVLGHNSPFQTFIPAVILSAYLGGLWPGLLATLLGAAAADYFLIEPSYSFGIADPANAVTLVLFVLAGTMISSLSESLHRMRRRLVANERQRVEEAMRETDQRFRQLAENIREIFWVQEGMWTRTLYVSPAYEEVWGRTCQSLYEQPGSWIDSIHPDDRDMVLAHLEQEARGSSTTTEFRVVRPDHSIRWVRCRAFPIKNQVGEAYRIAGFAEDITERKQVLEELRDAHERLELAVRSSNVALWEQDMTAGPDGRLKILNFLGRWGSTTPYEYLNARAAKDLVHPDDQEALARHFEAYLRGQVNEFKSSHRIRHTDGSYRWSLSQGMLFRDARGNPVRLLGSTIDITDLKRLETELRQANNRLELAVRGSKVGIWDVDMPEGILDNGRQTFINCWELLGYDNFESTADYAGPLNSLHPDDRERVESADRAYLAGESPKYEVEFRCQHQDGTYRWMLARGVAVRDATGRPVRFVGSSVDITDLKQAEESLRISEQRFRTFVDHASDSFFLLNEAQQILDVNRRACQSLGYTRDELVGMTPADLDTGVARNEHDTEEIERRLKAGEMIAFESRHRRKDRTVFPVEVRAQAFWQGESRFTVALARDVTDRKRAEEALHRAKEAAEAANRAKDAFLANVSHEIRTPMNAILGMTDLALDSPLREEQRQYLKAVKSGAESLLGIINDLLDFSKIEAAKMELDPAPFSLRAALGDTLRVLAMRAHKKGLELLNHVQPGVPDGLVGDAARLRQVLLNLVGNAIKFTSEGEVEVRVELTAPVPEGDVGVQFTVRDTGVGIAPDKREAIFRAFEQEDTSTTRKYGGTGLGLTIASRLVALMGGVVTVESELGRGSTFAFTVRFGKQINPPAPMPARPPVLLHELRVLVVDDNVTNCQILEGWLRDWQMEPHTAGDGLSALNALWHGAAAGRPYPLVLLDARMPDTDGLTLAGMIRERPELSSTRIILLTSGDRPGDPARLYALRIDAHLLKPVQQDELLEAIYHVMSRAADEIPPARAAQDAVPTPDPSAATLRVLVAEDNELSAQLLEQLLVRRGHRVTLTANGRDALALVGSGDFDLLLLDVHMPELDGFDVVQAIRKREESAGGHLPVVALTARSRREDREKCLAAGMDHFLTKPIRPADLWAAIDRVVTTHPSRTAPRLELLDVPVLLAACGGDSTLLRKMCQSLQKRVPEHLAALRDALREQDAARLREAAHKCCGLLSEFSTVAGDRAGNLEDAAARGALDETLPILKEVEMMATQLVRLAEGLALETLRSNPSAS